MALTGVFVLLIVFLITMSAVVISMISGYTKQLPDLKQIVIPAAKETTKVYASNGQVIADLYEENREYATYQEIPDSLKLAFIAVEDERFFKHRGVDLEGIGRALFLFVSTGGVKRHGASTITQQLVRITYLADEVKLESGMKDKLIRKLKEWILAGTIEKKYSKEEILESYLNMIYLGHGAFGVKTAARIFFGKDMKELTLAESALLAALPKGPSIYTPYVYPERAMRRRNAILQKMLDLNLITQQEFKNAESEGFNLVKLTGPGYENYKAPYFVTYLLDMLQDPDGPFKLSAKQIYDNGYRIYTTLDLRKQIYAERALRFGMGMVHQGHFNITQGALVAMKPQTGGILAMVGGLDYKTSKFNRAWQALRQPGSSFKPFIYITALKQGYSMQSIVVDSRVCYDAFPKAYCPHNYDNTYKGSMTFAYAMRYSRNIPAVKVCSMVGPKNAIETARSMGLTTHMSPDLSLALGSFEVTPLEMAVAYSTIANGGYRVEPVAVERITDSTGRLIYQKKYKTGERVLDDNVISQIIPAMESVITSGTGTRAKIDRPAGGKTGTTSEYRDAWFCGYVPQMAAIVWYGNDNNSPLRAFSHGKPVGTGVTGGLIPAPAWAYFMKNALAKEPARDFELPTPKSALRTANTETAEASGTEKINLDLIEKRNFTAPDNTGGKKPLNPDYFEFDTGKRKKPTSETQQNEGELDLIEPDKTKPDNGTSDYDNLF
jgi:penicillin-binding protein 1A